MELASLNRICQKFLFLNLSSCVVFVLCITNITQAETIVEPSEIGWTCSYNSAAGGPYTSLGIGPEIFTLAGEGHRRFWIWLKYDLPPYDPNSLIAAHLCPTVSNFYGTDEPDYGVGVYYVNDNSWSQSVITWNTQPTDFDTEPLDIREILSYEESYVWDITQGVLRDMNNNTISLLVKFNYDTFPNYNPSVLDAAYVRFITTSLNLVLYEKPVYDGTAPIVVLEEPETKHTNSGPIDINVMYTGAETVNLNPDNIILHSTGDALGTVSVLNGTTDTPVIRISDIYGDGMLWVDIMPGTSLDALGNTDSGPGDTAFFTQFVVDNTLPNINISAPYSSPTGAQIIPVSIAFSEVIYGFDINDIFITNGIVIDVETDNNKDYLLYLQAVEPGTISIHVPYGVAYDHVGNPNNESNIFSIAFEYMEPEIEIDVDRVINSFNYGETVDAQNFTLKNSGGGTLIWTLDIDMPWISCFPSSGELEAEMSSKITIEYSADGLDHGVYEGLMSIHSLNAVISLISIPVVLAITENCSTGFGISWSHWDLVQCFDADDRELRGPVTYTAGSGLCGNDFFCMQISNPHRDEFILSFSPEYEQLWRYIMPSVTGYSWPVYYQNIGFVQEDDYVEFIAGWCTTSVKTGGMGAIGYCMDTRIIVDGMWQPEEAGMFNGTVIGFPGSESNRNWRWLVSAVGRRISPGNWTSVNSSESNLWTSADLVIGNISENSFEEHKTAILSALSLGVVVVVNENTYEYIKASISHLETSEEIFSYGEAELSCLKGFGRGILVKSCNNGWAIRWGTIQKWGTPRPSPNYRDIAKCLNQIAMLLEHPDPVYSREIASVEDFLELSSTPADWDKHFVLTADLDLQGQIFNRAPIANFTGIFDGNGHIISNFNIIDYESNFLGLFGYTCKDAQINNLGIKSINIQGSTYAGGLVGWNSGSITNCYSKGVISGISDVGGLIGRNQMNANVINCYSDGLVSGDDYIGGLVGCNSGIISNCYSIVSVSGNTTHVGGLLGGNNGIVTDSFWSRDAQEQPTNSIGTGKTENQMRELLTYTNAGWNFDNVWAICDRMNYPRLQWEILPADFLCPDGVGLEDLVYFFERWLLDDCDLSNEYCGWADLNMDGIVDFQDFILISSYWLKDYVPIPLRFELADLNFRVPYITGVDVGDINQNGHIDIAFVGNFRGDFVVLNNGDGTFSSFALGTSGNRWAVHLVDFDNDGDLDFSWGNGGHINDNGTFEITPHLNLPDGARDAVVFADFTGNGYPDAAGRGFVALNQEGQGFVVTQTINSESNYGAAAGDVNNNGHIDIAIGNKIWLNDGTGTFSDSGIDLLVGDGSVTRGRKFADLNNNGYLDLVIANRSQGTYVLLNDKEGGFYWTGELLATSWNVALGDVNNNGSIDIITSDPLCIYLNDGSGYFGTPVLKMPSDRNNAPIRSIAVADFNGDGYLDIVSSDWIDDLTLGLSTPKLFYQVPLWPGPRNLEQVERR